VQYGVETNNVLWPIQNICRHYTKQRWCKFKQNVWQFW